MKKKNHERTRSLVFGATEEIRLKIFGSRDLSVFLTDLLNTGDSVYTRKNLYANLGNSVKMCLICAGTPVKTCWKFWQSYLFQVRSPPSFALLKLLAVAMCTVMVIQKMQRHCVLANKDRT